jgi:hypothetical protein
MSGQGQGGKQTYVVKTDFTDDKGRKWSVGSAFQGDDEAVRKALAAGRIAEKRAEPDAEPKPA